MRSSMLRCRRRKLPSSWNSTKRKARRLCLLRRSPTRAAPRRREAVACVVVAEGARTSLAVADLDREAVAVEASRTEETLEEVRLMWGKSIEAVRHKIVIHISARMLELYSNYSPSVCSSWPTWRLQPSSSWLPASSRLQRRIPQPWQLQPRWRPHA